LGLLTTDTAASPALLHEGRRHEFLYTLHVATKYTSRADVPPHTEAGAGSKQLR
jgi:hypothetical protein